MLPRAVSPRTLALRKAYSEGFMAGLGKEGPMPMYGTDLYARWYEGFVQGTKEKAKGRTVEDVEDL